MRRSRVLAIGASLAALAGLPSVALAGEFDERGVFTPSSSAFFFESFDEPERYVPADTEETCLEEQYTLVEDEALALEGSSFVTIRVKQNCAERFSVPMPETLGSYRASVWLRHGSAGVRFIVKYPDEVGGMQLTARLAPTGRATSDGWIELASNELPVDPTRNPALYLRFTDFASSAGVDFDALEITPSGDYREVQACAGIGDPICGEDAICVSGQCRLGGPSVPPLPPAEIRDEVVDSLAGKIEVFFGGQKTRTVDMPNALATLEEIRAAETAWQFWNGWARAVRQLHDWHTSASGSILEGAVRGRLNVCFIEGDADLSHDVLPSDPVYKDILVSHVGSASTAGLRPGDRLVAVDGQHPIAWARELVSVYWGYHVACDDRTFADFAEALGGPTWGGALILQFARTISVIRCDAETDTCEDQVETIDVADLPFEEGGQDVACDNRPTYHLETGGPSEDNHYVFGGIFRGKIANTTDDERIQGMVWDTLYGGGSPSSAVNSAVLAAVADWKQNARGVILDHRAGNGGTIDTPEYFTQLVRPPAVVAILPLAITSAGFAGPSDPTSGIALFEELKSSAAYTVGSVDYDPALPVALITHRDGSASDYLPFGMKGAPNVKLFGPGPTAGAFSTFIQFSYWGGINFQLASGDTITNEGQALLGHGVVPDVVIDQKQSDLMNGVDTLHEAALAWVRQELKP